MDRRFFLFACVVAPPGIWLASRGVVSVSTRFVARIGGSCSFCGKPSEQVRAIVGVRGSPVRICDTCVDLCFEILEELGARRRHAPLEPGLGSRPLSPQDVVEIFADSPHVISTEQARRQIASLYPRVPRVKLDALTKHERCVRCSFCLHARWQVRKLVTGPRIFICDDCSIDAAGVIAAAG